MWTNISQKATKQHRFQPDDLNIKNYPNFESCLNATIRQVCLFTIFVHPKPINAPQTLLNKIKTSINRQTAVLWVPFTSLKVIFEKEISSNVWSSHQNTSDKKRAHYFLAGGEINKTHQQHICMWNSGGSSCKSPSSVFWSALRIIIVHLARFPDGCQPICYIHSGLLRSTLSTSGSLFFPIFPFFFR